MIRFGLPNGKGIFTLKNGEKYVGDFKNGKLNGHAIHTSKMGNKYTGSWKILDRGF